MDPFSAMMIAALLTWGTAGGGIKDTSAILKGQTPPSYAYRAAKLQAGQKAAERDHAMLTQARERGEPVPAALEGRRIRIKDLARHWWEDALEDADHWRAGRHASRGERKARRKAWRHKRKAQVEKGYELLKERGQQRFGPSAEGPGGPGPQEPEQQEQQQQEEAAGQGPGPVPDNVVPLHPEERPGPQAGERGQDQQEEKEQAAPSGLPDVSPDQTNREAQGGPRPNSSSEEHAMIDLSDAPTLDAHQRALESYASYLDKIAADMDALAAGMSRHRMGQIAVGAVTTAGIANGEAASDVRQRKEELVAAHTRVAEARAAAPDAADGEYLTRGK